VSLTMQLMMRFLLGWWSDSIDRTSFDRRSLSNVSVMSENQNALACEEEPFQGFLSFNARQHSSTVVTSATLIKLESKTPFATTF